MRANIIALLLLKCDVLVEAFILQLAREMASRDIGYRRMSTFSVTVNQNDSPGNRRQPDQLPDWIDATGESL